MNDIGIKCPHCGMAAGSTVTQTRQADAGRLRRRRCRHCRQTFATEEVIATATEEVVRQDRLEVEDMAQMFAAGHTLPEVAQVFGLSRSAVQWRLSRRKDYQALKHQSLAARRHREALSASPTCRPGNWRFTTKITSSGLRSRPTTGVRPSNCWKPD